MSRKRTPKRRPSKSVVQSTIQLSIGGTPVTFTAEMEAAPTRPRRMLPVFRELTNAVVSAAITASEARGAPISCRPGCYACCTQLIPITTHEAHAIAAIVRGLPPARAREVDDRFAAAEKQLERAGILERLAHPERVSEDEKEALALAYFALRIECPFLDADKTCSIRAERPLVCREYLVTSDAKHCDAPTAETIEMVPLAAEVSDALGRLERDEGEPPAWVPLVLAPRWALENPDPARDIPATEILERVLALL